MANCNTHFEEYNGKIRLTDARRKNLKTSRKELRKKVKNGLKKINQMKHNLNLIVKVLCQWIQSSIQFQEN